MPLGSLFFRLSSLIWMRLISLTAPTCLMPSPGWICESLPVQRPYFILTFLFIMVFVISPRSIELITLTRVNRGFGFSLYCSIVNNFMYFKDSLLFNNRLLLLLLLLNCLLYLNLLNWIIIRQRRLILVRVGWWVWWRVRLLVRLLIRFELFSFLFNDFNRKLYKRLK